VSVAQEGHGTHPGRVSGRGMGGERQRGAQRGAEGAAQRRLTFCSFVMVLGFLLETGGEEGNSHL
jgi:hypothetical protein